MKNTKKIICTLLAIIMLVMSVPISAGAASYPKISALQMARIYQPKDDTVGLCYWASMTTVQAYCLGTYTYGGVTTSYRTPGTDYNYKNYSDAVSKKMKTYNGYVTDNLNTFPVKMTLVTSGIGNNTATYEKIYNQLKQGKPVIIYTGSHASIVIAYNGSTSSLQASGFTVMEIKKWSDTLWYNNTNAFNKYANAPQTQSKSSESCYVTLDSWTNNVGAITQICYPTNAVSGAIDTDPPPAPQLKVDKSTITLGETATITWPSCGSNVTYWINIFKGSENIYSGRPSGNLTHAFKPTEAVYYKISVIATGSNGKQSSSSIGVDCKANVTLSSVSVSAQPTKTVYIVGENLNTDGLKLEVVYSDGSKKTVTSGFTCSPTSLSTVGTQKITVTYEGKSTSFNVTVNPKSVDTAGTVKIEAISSYASSGGTATVKIKISDNPGIAYLKLKIDYDSSVMTLTNVKNENLLSASFQGGASLSDDPYVLVWSGSENSENNGNIVTLTFKIKDGVKDGAYPVTVTSDDCFDSDEKPVNAVTENGKITVGQTTFGDVNGDGKIDGRDSTLLMKYLAEWDVSVDEKAADVNNDGKIDGRDSTLLMKYLAEWDVTLG